MKIVVDCNIVISAGYKEGVCRNVLLDILKNHTPIFSQAILEEFTNVANRKKHAKYKSAIIAFVDAIITVGTQVEPAISSSILPDPKDQVYLDTAFTANAEVIITGNTKDFPVDTCQPVKILKPSEFMP